MSIEVKYREALQRIAQMSDHGSAATAMIRMKVIAAKALSVPSRPKLSQKQMAWCLEYIKKISASPVEADVDTCQKYYELYAELRVKHNCRDAIYKMLQQFILDLSITNKD